MEDKWFYQGICVKLSNPRHNIASFRPALFALCQKHNAERVFARTRSAFLFFRNGFNARQFKLDVEHSDALRGARADYKGVNFRFEWDAEERNRTVYVIGMGRATSHAEITDKFSRCPGFEGIRFNRSSSGSVFVDFDSEETALATKLCLDGQPLLGGYLQVRFHRGSPARSPANSDSDGEAGGVSRPECGNAFEPAEQTEAPSPDLEDDDWTCRAPVPLDDLLSFETWCPPQPISGRSVYIY